LPRLRGIQISPLWDDFIQAKRPAGPQSGNASHKATKATKLFCRKFCRWSRDSKQQGSSFKDEAAFGCGQRSR